MEKHHVPDHNELSEAQSFWNIIESGELGQPAPYEDDFGGWDVTAGEDNAMAVHMFHPVFKYARHYRGHDEGRSGPVANPGRGDYMLIPAYSEDGEVGFLRISFHKGETLVDAITYPYSGSEAEEKAMQMLQIAETR